MPGLGENHGTLMILDGVSYSAFIYLCRVILSHMMNPTVVSLQSDPFWSRRVPLFGTYVSRRLLTPAVFPLQCYAVNTIRSISSFQDS